MCVSGTVIVAPFDASWQIYTKLVKRTKSWWWYWSFCWDVACRVSRSGLCDVVTIRALTARVWLAFLDCHRPWRDPFSPYWSSNTRPNSTNQSTIMAFSYKEIYCGSTIFCCCIPVRIGVITMSCLGICFAGMLAIVLWFEFFTSSGMITTARIGFALAALLETSLFIASILGFVGTVVRKLLFIEIYAVFLYFHLLLTVGIAALLLSSITRLSTQNSHTVCGDTISNTDGSEQCIGILKIALWVHYAVVALVLSIEIYVAWVITRYLYQLKQRKVGAKSSYSTPFLSNSGIRNPYLSVSRDQDEVFDIQEFNPYELAPRELGSSHGPLS